MPLREFLDATGVEWSVWEVQPLLLERRTGDDVVLADGERRNAPTRRAPVAIELRFGWLVFQSATSKRRLAPVPKGWDRIDDVALCGLLARATARSAPRLVVEASDAVSGSASAS